MFREVIDKVKDISEKVTNIVMNYTEVEARVREATNADPWGPHTTLMDHIVQDTMLHHSCLEAMNMLWKRMYPEDEMNWRSTYKSLVLLTYILKNGSEQAVSNTRDHLYDIKSLDNYRHTDQHGKDQGINVRHKVKDIVNLLEDHERLREERDKAKNFRKVYNGIGSSNYSASYGDYRDRDYNENYDSDVQNRSRYTIQDVYKFPDKVAEQATEYEASSPPLKYADPTNIKTSVSDIPKVKLPPKVIDFNNSESKVKGSRPAMIPQHDSFVQDLVSFDDSPSVSKSENKEQDLFDADFTDFQQSQLGSNDLFFNNQLPDGLNSNISNPIPNNPTRSPMENASAQLSSVSESFANFQAASCAPACPAFNSPLASPSASNPITNLPPSNHSYLDTLSGLTMPTGKTINDAPNLSHQWTNEVLGESSFASLNKKSDTVLQPQNISFCSNDMNQHQPTKTGQISSTSTSSLGGIWANAGSLKIDPDDLIKYQGDKKSSPSLRELKEKNSNHSSNKPPRSSVAASWMYSS